MASTLRTPLPPPKASVAQISLCGLFSFTNSGSVPGRAAPAGESSRKPEEQDKSFGVADQGVRGFLVPFPAPPSKGPHHRPAPSLAPAWAGWYFHSEWPRTCCRSGGASLGHEIQAVSGDVPQPGTEGTPGQPAEPRTPCRGCSLQGPQGNNRAGIRQQGARDAVR